jgi:TetR/AcrR family transcriptional regulator, repressor for neighboring sulfatase
VTTLRAKVQAKRAARQATRAVRQGERKVQRADRHVDRQAQAGTPGHDDKLRKRRSPDVARQELLDAAERVFLEFAPDQVGLKEVAREAGVSHALITHYFGTYAGLIEAALQRRLDRLRGTMVARIREAGALAKPEELLAVLFATFDDPVHLRLMKWMIASERPGVMHAIAMQQQGLQLVARQVATAVQPQPSPDTIETVELTLMTALAAALGYAASKYALAGAAGRPVGVALDDAVRRTLAGMVRAYLTECLGPLPVAT